MLVFANITIKSIITFSCMCVRVFACGVCMYVLEREIEIEREKEEKKRGGGGGMENVEMDESNAAVFFFK